ncbi:hypothetical protein HPP92_022180 [Vanilla planifolia]|uniref:AB hydrolase-1 domain-containing protein n=1 Tax=Vanilla planifolia TaxID=51239 RepID=A0A835UEV6_VANPL|nr:hypothetical protein HPP92_022180 [Vanilla planifolia]
MGMSVALLGRSLTTAISFVVFAILDLLDAVLCIVYKLVDLAVEGEWRHCYCFPSAVSVNSCVVDSVSDTLHRRHSLLPLLASVLKAVAKPAKRGGCAPRWSDCSCKTCSGWTHAGDALLHLHAEGNLESADEDVVFIHGFISSSVFWTETVFKEMSAQARARYRLLAVDLLGFGRSPKPEESMYTIREHVAMIERSVLQRHGVRRFHLVAHSLGSVLALAIAARHRGAVLSITLIAPPYFPGEGGWGVMRKVAPRRVWPPMDMAASMACWYEHVSRTICLVICRQHRLWEAVFRLITMNRYKTFLFEGFMCHSHNAAWHTLHNVICNNTDKMDYYLDILREQLKCDVNIFHGQGDKLIPLECSYALQSKIPRASLRVIHDKDHITVVVGRQKILAMELEKIWSIAKKQ